MLPLSFEKLNRIVQTVSSLDDYDIIPNSVKAVSIIGINAA